MCGMLVGSFVLGVLGDMIGRKKTILLSGVLVSVFGSLNAFVSSPVLYAFFRFLTGMGGIGLFLVSYVLASELTTPRYVLVRAYEVVILSFEGKGYCNLF